MKASKFTEAQKAFVIKQDEVRQDCCRILPRLPHPLKCQISVALQRNEASIDVEDVEC